MANSLCSHYSSAKRNPSNTKSSIFIASLVGEESEPQCNKQRKIAGQRELFLKCPSTTSPATFKLCDCLFACWAFVGVAVLLFALIKPYYSLDSAPLRDFYQSLEKHQQTTNRGQFICVVRQ